MGKPRASTTARGYGSKHQAERKRWAPIVATGTVTCWRCGHPITATEPWDLGHDDNDRTRYRGPEHRGRCNRRSAAIKGNKARGVKRRRQGQQQATQERTTTLTLRLSSGEGGSEVHSSATKTPESGPSLSESSGSR